jgi:cytoskeletal protein RodZ
MENKKSTMWLIVLAVVIVVILLIWSMNKGSAPTPVSTTTTDNTTTEPASTQDVSTVTGITGAASISYTDALVKYADRRIQLDKMCQASPMSVTYKDNTGIMIDNRSAMTRTVKVGTTFTIKPYGFRIVVLPDVILKSKTLLVDCDKSQNVATILVQE